MYFYIKNILKINRYHIKKNIKKIKNKEYIYFFIYLR
jgi:hypothetical protein